ncbi:AEC family transporter [Roseibium sp. RKSG952]|nr:AEC family transporter [Roseibium sp. RKSG952]
MASGVFSIVVPVFILIALGYGLARFKVLGPSVGEALGQYVYVVAIPVLIFRTLAVVNLDGETPYTLWASYFTGVAAAWTLGTLVIRRGFGREARAGVIGGISAAFANTIMVGLPLVSELYGGDGLVPILLIISVHLPIMTVVTAILMERAVALDGLGEAVRPAVLLRRIARNLVTNPIVIGIVCSLVWRSTGLPIEGVLQDVLDKIAATALPVALFSLGMSMVAYGMRGNVLPGLILSLIKMIVMPAVVFAAGAFVFQLPPLWTAVATLTAACPTGVNAYIFANRYGTGHAMSTNAITVTTAAAVVTTGLWAIWLDIWTASP